VTHFLLICERFTIVQGEKIISNDSRRSQAVYTEQIASNKILLIKRFQNDRRIIGILIDLLFPQMRIIILQVVNYVIAYGIFQRRKSHGTVRRLELAHFRLGEILVLIA